MSAVLSTVFWAVLLGTLIALPLGRQRQLSVELWLLAVSVWLARATVLGLLARAPAHVGKLQPAWTWRRQGSEGLIPRPRQMASLEGLVLSARDNDRSYALRLRPRLRRLVDHHLRVRHGIDPDHEPDRAAAVLGDVGWLVDPAVDRRPTLAEIDRLLDRLLEPPGFRRRQVTIGDGRDG